MSDKTVANFGYKDVQKAYERIHKYVYRTPLEESLYLGDESRKYFFKLENTQTVKSFKIRGALNKMLSLTEEEKKRGVATISSGNHGASVSYASRLLNIQNAYVMVPKTTPKSKVDKIKFYGANVMLMGKNYDEAHKLGMQFIEENGMIYIDPYYDDPKVYGGQGTVAIEILDQNPCIDTIVVPIGGGGLITGIAVAAKHIKPGIRVIGVQTEACPAMIKSYEDNVFYEEYPNTESVCDALIGGVGKLSYEMAKDYVDDFIIVKEENIKKAVSFMIKQEKYIAEPGSATVIAAVDEYRERIGGKNIALVISGGNIDGDLMVDLLKSY
mgnify:CR=1 FL=1